MIEEGESIKRILEDNKILTLGTVHNNRPWINSAFYVFDEGFNLYIWTDISSRHAKNIGKNNKVAISIASTKQSLGSLLQGLQMEGIAKKISEDLDLKRGAWLYAKRFPKIKKIMKNYQHFNEEIFGSALYKIVPMKIKIIDEKRFGKEIYKEVTLK